MPLSNVKLKSKATLQQQQPVVLLGDGFHVNGNNQVASLCGSRIVVSDRCLLRKGVRTQHEAVSEVHPVEEIFSFLGVPFAETPQRFAQPRSFSKLWSGCRRATRFGAVCPQPASTMRQSYHPYAISELMSEDCLFLNVWTPTTDRKAKLPVLVWIIGGLWVNAGSNYFDGTAYASLHNVVFVSFNYRVGLLGFMSTGDHVVPGNMGLLDQVEALRWIQKHIHCFGGDPDNVCLIGDSAGAMSISWLMLFPLSRGLFKRGILQGGTMCFYESVMSRDEAKRRFRQVLQKFGLDEHLGTETALSCLRTVSVSDLVEVGAQNPYIPVLDGELIIEHPMCSFYKRKFTGQIDVMFVLTTDEAFHFVLNCLRQTTGTLDPVVNVGLARRVAHTIVYDKYFPGHPKAGEILSALWSEYIADNDDPEVLFKGLVEMWGDLLFISPCVQLANLHSNSSLNDRPTRTYMCQFDHRPSYSRHADWATAAHGHQVPFLIGLPFLNNPSNNSTEDDHLTCQLMMNACSNFARNGNPNVVCKDLYWPEYDVTHRCYANMRVPPTVCRDFRKQRMKFWQDVVNSLILNNLKLTTGSKL